MEHDLVYAVAGYKELHISITTPDNPSSDRLPVVVWIHGGGWQGGDYASNVAAQLGDAYVAASIQYRFSSEAIFPAQIHDCKAAIRFLRANAGKYGIDPDRIGVWGGSAGGHLAALLGTSGDVAELEGDLGNNEYSSRVQAVCEYFGPVKFLPNDDEPPAVTQVPEVVTQLFGGTREEKPELYRLGSPFEFISSDDPPHLLVYGDIDPLVPWGQGELFHKALIAAGVDSTFIKVTQGDHGFHQPDQQPNNEEIFAEVASFFKKRLQP